jgi:hypothetical protein
MGHPVSPNTVRKLLVTDLGFSRQSNRKTDEGANHPDRNAQFEYINAAVLAARAACQPVISVDRRPKGDPLRVNVHDFPDQELGKVAPYGVYDIAANAGWVSLGITHDTAAFAVASIRTVELQKLADETNLTIKVRHYPPGTPKWNKIEHRLFCHISQNWRGRPLCHDHRPDRGDHDQDRAQGRGRSRHHRLRERCQDHNAEMKRLNIRGDAFHPEWNYTVVPRSKS